MTTTFTQDHSLMMHHYEHEIAVKALLADKIILFPTDTVWSMGCLPEAGEALHQMLLLKRTKRSENFELLFDSIQHLKQYFPRLHPRLETLLAFHTRPLTLVLPDPVGLPELIYCEENAVAVRIVQDLFTKTLIESVDAPIVSSSACVDDEEAPAHFGAIRSDFLQGVDYVVKFKQKDKNMPGQPAVKVKLSEDEELIFLRE